MRFDTLTASFAELAALIVADVAAATFVSAISTACLAALANVSYAVLAAATLAAYWPILSNDFVKYDDPAYVTENVHVLREFRKNCKTLIALGACAVTGGLPAQRNHLDLGQCLQEVYQFSMGVESGQVPNDLIPLLAGRHRQRVISRCFGVALG